VLAAGVAGGAAFGIARVDAGLLGAGEGVLDDVQVSRSAAESCMALLGANQACSARSRNRPVTLSHRTAMHQAAAALMATACTCHCPSLQAFLTGIIGEGRGALAAADDMLASLGEVQAALDEQVNVTGEHLMFCMTLPQFAVVTVGWELRCSRRIHDVVGCSSTTEPAPLPADIGAQLQCLAPLLDALPEPAALAANITAANASVDSTLRPALASLSTQLGSLAGRLEPGVGAYVQALETAAGAPVLLFDTPGGIVTQANASGKGGGRKGCGPQQLRQLAQPGPELADVT